MTFPVYLHVGPVLLHPHWVFETLAYTVAFAIYRWQRQRRGDVVDDRARRWVIVAAAVGGLVGSRLLHLLESPTELTGRWTDIAFVLGGKTIVGGLLGGLTAVEVVKRCVGVRVATGDLLALPLAVGIAVGRIGCFLSGLPDGAYGNATALPWGVDFGDGIARHPTQLYEMVFLVGVAALLAARRKRLAINGDAFKLFMVAYLSFRLLADAIKPAAAIGGLSVIQWACVAAIAYYAPHIPRLVAEVRHG